MKKMLALEQSFLNNNESYKERERVKWELEHPNMSYGVLEKARNAAANNEIYFEYAQDHYLDLVLTMWQECVPCFHERMWSVFVNDGLEDSYFISSDNSVCLDWIDPSHASCVYGLGLANPNTVISIPLSSNIAICGIFDGESESFVANAGFTSALNSKTAKNAKGFYFLHMKHLFIWAMKEK